MKTVEKGFIDVYGCKWDQVQCNTYNSISAEIEQKESYYNVNSELAVQELNFLKDQRHRIYHLPLWNLTRPIVNNQAITAESRIA